MALAIGTSLLEQPEFNPFGILKEWAAWYRSGIYSCNGQCFDVGHATREALQGFLHNSEKLPSVPENALGNAPLMRLAPAVLAARSECNAARLAHDQAVLTHGEEAAVATAEYGKLLYRTMHSGFDGKSIPRAIRDRPREQVNSSGFYRDTLEAALWAVGTTSTFEDAIVQAVNLGDDADTVGAVAGQLAGAIYGASAIPVRWLESLAWRRRIEAMAVSLLVL